MPMDNMIGIDLPAGWIASTYGGSVVLQHPEPMAGYVSLNFERREFYSGCTVRSNPVKKCTYTGRGWHAALVNDTVSWLTSIYAAKESNHG